MSEPEFVNLLRSPGIDSQSGGIDFCNRFLGFLTFTNTGSAFGIILRITGDFWNILRSIGGYLKARISF